MKHLTRTIVLGVVVVLLLAAAVVWQVSRAGSGAVEAWIASQFKQMVNTRLNPQLSFEDLDYTYPYTVSLKNMRLVASDPADPRRSVDILACGSATVTLAQIPRVGEPVHIQELILERPQFTAVAISPGSPKAIGFSNMVRDDRPKATQPTTRVRFSELLSIRLIELRDGRILYDPRLDDTEPMVLDQINTKLVVTPTEGGWYKLATTIARKPVFELSVAGQVNLDTFDARDAALKLWADVHPDKLNYLPPQVQAFLGRYQVRGALSCVMMGDFPIMRPTHGELSADVTLSDANVKLGEYRIPVQKLDLSARMEDQHFSITRAQVQALEGSAQFWGTTLLDEQFETTLELKVAGMLLQDLLEARGDGQPPKLAGKVDAEAQLRAPVRVVMDTIDGEVSGRLPEKWGAASLRLTEGRLLKIPFLSRLHDMVVKFVGVGGEDDGKLHDRLSAAVQMTGDNIEVTELLYVGHFMAARGSGRIELNRRLDLKLNAGPVERMQEMLGQRIGGAIARVTDKIVSYRVTGKIGEPQVDVEVAGGAIDKISERIRGMMGEK